MIDIVRELLTRCHHCSKSGPTRVVPDDVQETRLCWACWGDVRHFRSNYGLASMIPMAEWPEPETNYDPAKGEPGTR